MTKKQFKPFEHEELELKNNLIDYARSLAAKKNADAQLACSMIYSSFAEYMAGHLLDTLRYIMYQVTHTNFAAILYIDQRKDSEIKTLGKVIGMLKTYGFPDKDEIIELLIDISKSRNNLFHNFAKKDLKGLDLLDEDIDIIKQKTEELFIKINTVYTGLQKIILVPEAKDIKQQKP